MADLSCVGFVCSGMWAGCRRTRNHIAIAGNSVRSMRTATGTITVCRKSGETTVTANSTRKYITVEAIMMTMAAERAALGSVRASRA